VPLTSLQRLVVTTLREYRTEHDYVGGGAALNQRWPRLSDDMDIFCDFQSLPQGPVAEVEALGKAGFSVEITTHDEWMLEVIVQQYGFQTRVQWINDPESCNRFFPATHDEEFGFRLHSADNAINKVLCAARRQSAPRDAVDLVSIATKYAPLGPLIPGKDPRLNPNTVISEIRKNAFGYSDAEIRAVRMEDNAIMTREEVRRILDDALKSASIYCDDAAPDDYLGHLLVDSAITPVEATVGTIRDGLHKPIAISDFGTIPRILSD
jgi:hypothetical protein